MSVFHLTVLFSKSAWDSQIVITLLLLLLMMAINLEKLLFTQCFFIASHEGLISSLNDSLIIMLSNLS